MRTSLLALAVYVASAPSLRPNPVKHACEYFLPWVSGLYLHFYSPKSIKSRISNIIIYKEPAINISDVCGKVL